ncbi:MAG: N-6 DNA methylase [Oceanococcaceae bacterium]
MLLPPTEHEEAIDAVHQATAIYTTVSVVEALLDRLDWPTCGGRLLDPSAGDGAFLVAAIERLAPAPGDLLTLSRVRGYEFHAGAVSDARCRVADVLRKLGWTAAAARKAAPTVVEQRDFLTEGGRESTDLIAGNPPYLAWSRLPDYFKTLYADVVAKYANRDLLYAFVDQCTKVLSPHGAIAVVTSDRWLFNQTAAELRSAVGKQVSLAHVERLDVSTSFYRPKLRRAGSLPRIHPVSVVLRRTGTDLVPITAAPISPDGHEDTPWTGPTLSDIATIRLAPWLGPHGVFTIDAQQADTLGPHADLVPVVDTDDVDPATDRLAPPSRMAIRTQRAVEPQGPVSAHLLATRDRMPPRGLRGPYWVPPESLPAALDEPSLMVPRIAQRIRVIDLPAGVSAINHNITVIRHTAGGPSLDEIRAVLLSAESHAWLLRHAPRLENGYLSITTSLLRRLPFTGTIPASLDLARAA